MTVQQVSAPRKTGSRCKQFRRRITYSNFCFSLLSSLGYALITVYAKLLRTKIIYHPEFLQMDRSKTFFGFWHGRQFLLIPIAGTWGVSILADLSWAGEIQARILRRFGYVIVRGSSNRQNVRALLGMRQAMENGHPGAFALDGPSGPIYHSKAGIIFLAQKMNCTIVPVIVSAHKPWILKSSWCQYLLPKPFSKCYVSFEKPLKINLEFTSEKLDEILGQKTRAADRMMNVNRQIHVH